jgi:hypothetical protein
MFPLAMSLVLLGLCIAIAAWNSKRIDNHEEEP